MPTTPPTPHSPPSPAPSPPPSARATAIGLIAVVLWGASVGLTRSIAESFGPIGGAALVFSLSGLLNAWVLGLPRPGALSRTYLYGGGLLFVAYEICFALALGLAHDRAQALELGMINYLWPSLTVLLALLAGQQKGSWWLLPGLVLSFAGIVQVMSQGGAGGPGQGLASLQSHPLPYGLAAAAALLWAAYSVLTRRHAQGQNAVPLFLLATGALLWVWFGLSAQPALKWSAAGLAQVLTLAGFAAASFSCWNHGVQRGNMGLLAALSYLTPVLSAALGSLWLGLTLRPAFWQGVACVSGGSLLCWWATRARRQP